MKEVDRSDSGISEGFREAGIKPNIEDWISVNISYQIIQQVSSQLYTNPRRAVEELVCNSYDAGATECYVRTPDSPDEPLLVLDNGESMDLDGLDWLWTVAKSPKQTDSGERTDNNRKQIGKFGVGKLAAFALGRRLTHVATVDGETRVISVDDEEIHQAEETDEEDPEFPVRQLPEQEAKEALEHLFEDLPNPWENDWDTWTLAMVEQVDEENVGQTLGKQYLKRMLRTSIPLFSQFQIHLNGEPVPPRDEPEDDVVTVNIHNKDFRNRLEVDLRNFWERRGEYSDEEAVPDDLYKVNEVEMRDHQDIDKTINAVEIPRLGPVSGKATIYESTLSKDKLDERGFENHGFRVTVQGKLLNRHDPLFGVSQRSHKFWNRFLAEVEVPGLDEAILVQRNDVDENKIETQLTRQLLKTLFNYTRTEADEILESDEYKPKSFGERLNLLSPIQSTDAVAGLSESYPSGGVESIDIEPVSMDQGDPPVTYDSEKEVILVNEEHPLFQTLSEEYGFSNFRRTFREILAGNHLTMGYYHELGVDEPILQGGQEIFDDVLRSAASYFRDETEFLINEMESASHETDKAFEQALISGFRSMKLAANRYGASDLPDGVIEIPRAGESNFRISVEAKGKEDEGETVDHTDAKIATVRRHRDEQNCQWAVIIAREFQIDGRADKEKSGFLREIDTENQLVTEILEEMDEDSKRLEEGIYGEERGISLLPLDAVNELMRLHKERRFTNEEIRKILTNERHPDKIEQFIEQVWNELPDPSVIKVLLDAAWREQRDTEIRPSAGGLLAKQERVREVADSRDEVRDIVVVLSTITGNLIRPYEDGYEFELLSPPDAILEELFEAEGLDLNPDEDMIA